MENSKIENNEKESFEKVYQKYKETKDKLYELNKEKRLLEREFREITEIMQKKCKHVFVREVTTSGCYREVHNICSICGLWG
jgi:hypothetical protein